MKNFQNLKHNDMNNLNITWEKCIHGVEKRHPLGCQLCRAEERDFKNVINKMYAAANPRIPIRRGCHANGPCFCNGSCKEVIGYRDPLFPGERP